MAARILTVLVALLLTACGGKQLSTNQPEWVDNPGEGAVGIAVTHPRGRYYQEELAIARARERLAARLGVEVSSIHTINEHVENDRISVVSDKQTEQVVNKKTVKARVKETWYDKTRDVMYVLVVPN